MTIFSKQLDETRRRIMDIVTDVTLQVEATAKSVTAPQGATGQLRQNIVGNPAIELSGGLIVGSISSAAINQGVNYADIQHDVELYHANREGEPMKSSFSDFGTSGTPFERYESGYRSQRPKLGPQNKFATKYIDRAMSLNIPLLETSLKAEGYSINALKVST